VRNEGAATRVGAVLAFAIVLGSAGVEAQDPRERALGLVVRTLGGIHASDRSIAGAFDLQLVLRARLHPVMVDVLADYAYLDGTRGPSHAFVGGTGLGVFLFADRSGIINAVVLGPALAVVVSDAAGSPAAGLRAVARLELGAWGPYSIFQFAILSIEAGYEGRALGSPVETHDVRVAIGIDLGALVLLFVGVAMAASGAAPGPH